VGFQEASDILGITAAMGLVKTLTLIPVSYALDRSWGGRRRLLLLSYAGMGCALILLAIGSWSHSRMLLLPAIFLYVIFFSCGAGPVSWLLASEILPTQVRARGMMLAVVPNRLMASLVSLTFLSATSESASSAFCVFAAGCFLVCLFVYCRCPETKGRSLEDMAHLFAAIARHNARSSRSTGFASLFSVSPLILGTHTLIDDRPPGAGGLSPSSSPRPQRGEGGPEVYDDVEGGGESITTPMVSL
jgi:MFS family permease